MGWPLGGDLSNSDGMRDDRPAIMPNVGAIDRGG